jgi:hypothetical protein
MTDNYHSILFRGDFSDATVTTITPGDTMNFIEYGGVWKFRQVNGTSNTVRAYIDTTNGGGRLLDSTTYSYAANMNQNVRTSDSPTFAAITSNGENLTSYTNGISTVQGGSGYAIYRAYGNSNAVEVQLSAHQVSGYGTVGTYSSSNFGIKTSNTLRAYWDTSGHLLPNVTATYNLGSSSLRWSTVYTSDLSLRNEYGDYTIVEGPENLYLYNNKTEKVFKFLLEEVDPTTAPPKKPE